jgi:osmotically inducible protein OsmC
VASESTASAHWEGSLTKGSGTASPASGGFSDVEVTWQARVERTEGTTSPEELLAAAHAACYCMALSHELSEGGNEPESLDASATVGFVAGEGVKTSRITVRGKVPGIDQAAFEKAAAAAGEGCPISGALAGNVEIEVDATLDG